MADKFIESFKQSVIAIVPLAIRERNVLASIIFISLILIALHLVAIDTSEDKDLNGFISPLEFEFEFKKMSGMATFDYLLATLLVMYAGCIPFAIWVDDI